MTLREALNQRRRGRRSSPEVHEIELPHLEKRLSRGVLSVIDVHLDEDILSDLAPNLSPDLAPNLAPDLFSHLDSKLDPKTLRVATIKVWSDVALSADDLALVTCPLERPHSLQADLGFNRYLSADQFAQLDQLYQTIGAPRAILPIRMKIPARVTYMEIETLDERLMISARGRGARRSPDAVDQESPELDEISSLLRLCPSTVMSPELMTHFDGVVIESPHQCRAYLSLLYRAEERSLSTPRAIYPHLSERGECMGWFALIPYELEERFGLIERSLLPAEGIREVFIQPELHLEFNHVSVNTWAEQQRFGLYLMMCTLRETHRIAAESTSLERVVTLARLISYRFFDWSTDRGSRDITLEVRVKHVEKIRDELFTQSAELSEVEGRSVRSLITQGLLWDIPHIGILGRLYYASKMSLFEDSHLAKLSAHSHSLSAPRSLRDAIQEPTTLAAVWTATLLIKLEHKHPIDELDVTFIMSERLGSARAGDKDNAWLDWEGWLRCSLKALLSFASPAELTRALAGLLQLGLNLGQLEWCRELYIWQRLCAQSDGIEESTLLSDLRSAPQRGEDYPLDVFSVDPRVESDAEARERVLTRVFNWRVTDRLALTLNDSISTKKRARSIRLGEDHPLSPEYELSLTQLNLLCELSVCAESTALIQRTLRRSRPDHHVGA